MYPSCHPIPDSDLQDDLFKCFVWFFPEMETRERLLRTVKKEVNFTFSFYSTCSNSKNMIRGSLTCCQLNSVSCWCRGSASICCSGLFVCLMVDSWMKLLNLLSESKNCADSQAWHAWILWGAWSIWGSRSLRSSRASVSEIHDPN